VVLAGGGGRRLGGAKATANLGGRPLLEYPVVALRGVLREVVVVAKEGTALPPLGDTPVWTEASARLHPAVGLAHAIEQAGGRRVLVCAGDMPFVSAVVLRALLETGLEGAAAVVPVHAGQIQPLLALYEPAALDALREESDRPLREIVARLRPRRVELEDPLAFFNVNRPEDLREAEALLASRR
jgi:molybdopterin-guanine dinucleotide biosynthesis protein A